MWYLGSHSSSSQLAIKNKPHFSPNLSFGPNTKKLLVFVTWKESQGPTFTHTSKLYGAKPNMSHD